MMMNHSPENEPDKTSLAPVAPPIWERDIDPEQPPLQQEQATALRV